MKRRKRKILTAKEWIFHAKKELKFSRTYKLVKGFSAVHDCRHLTYATSHAIRAVLTYYNVEFGRKFFLYKLIPEFEKNKIRIPKEVKESVMMDKYEKLSTMYPYPPVTVKEVNESYKKVKSLIVWTEKKIKSSP